MKLLLIDQHSERNIDQVVVFVPDNYDADKVLAEARDFLDGEVYAESELDLPVGYAGRLPEYRFFVG
jgi:hypothetical protein